MNCELKTGRAEIWPYGKGYFKVYLENRDLAKRIAGWENCQLSGRYYDKTGRMFRWDIIFPSKLYNRVAILVSLPARTKNPKRVLQGQKKSETLQNYRFLRNTKLKQAPLAKDYEKVAQ